MPRDASQMQHGDLTARSAQNNRLTEIGLAEASFDGHAAWRPIFVREYTYCTAESIEIMPIGATKRNDTTSISHRHGLATFELDNTCGACEDEKAVKSRGASNMSLREQFCTTRWRCRRKIERSSPPLWNAASKRQAPKLCLTPFRQPIRLQSPARNSFSN
jgi:hypothetical protein